MWLLAALLPLVAAAQTEVDLRMPEVQPQTPDTYLCFARKMDQEAKYIVGFHTHAQSANAHHVLLYGCEQPGSASGQPWSCGEMSGSPDDRYPPGPVCGRGKQQILYAWAMDAPALELPQDVGFKVGGDTAVQYLVLQVHYKNVRPFLPPQNKKDTSGILLKETSTPQPRRAGVIIMGTGGRIPRDSTTYMETACSYSGKQTLHPFAFRTHGHGLAKVTSGYRVRDEKWNELGRKSPARPQMFYDVTDPSVTIQPQDVLAARCTFRNDAGHEVDIGATQNDEMCNFYLMYWVHGDSLPEFSSCWRAGPPFWSWADFRAPGFSTKHVPSSASQDPDTETVYESEEVQQNGLTQLLNTLLLRGEPLEDMFTY